MRKAVWTSLVVLLTAGLIAAGAGYFYWKSFEDTPQYSLALLFDAARRDDNAAVAELIDSDAVVDSFVPQVTAKAFELYGRGLPPQLAGVLSSIAAPMMPAIKQRAHDELPRLIRKETEKFGDVPFAAMVLGADRYLDIKVEGDTATVRAKASNHTFDVEMRRNGKRWQIVGVRDDALAQRIAETIGQQLMKAAKEGDLKRAGESLGIENFQEMLRQTEEIFR
ncbi:MAG: hypothetical protein KF855_16530 [Acidobacteria bacterium]|nr:hypothetical protein [Acidobacteriota bacterium]